MGYGVKVPHTTDEMSEVSEERAAIESKKNLIKSDKGKFSLDTNATIQMNEKEKRNWRILCLLHAKFDGIPKLNQNLATSHTIQHSHFDGYENCLPLIFINSIKDIMLIMFTMSTFRWVSHFGSEVCNL